MSQHCLPEDMWIQILKRLPVKSIGGYTIVSKQWHALVTSPSFISTHLHHALDNIGNEQSSKEDMALLISGNQVKQCALLGSRIEILGFPVDGSYRVVGTSSGLLCLVTESFECYTGVEKVCVILWNPSIRRSFVLPRPTIDLEIPQFDVFGFGADLRDGEACKVVRLVYPNPRGIVRASGYIRAKPRPPDVEVYSLKRRVWNRLAQPGISCNTVPLNKSQVFLNGRVHWLANQRRQGEWKNLILAFDMSDEVFSEIMVPGELSREHLVKLCCNLFEKYLTVVKWNNEANVTSCCIWLMKEYGVAASWTKTYNFDLVEGMQYVTGFLGDGEVLVRKVEDEFVSYDIKTGTIKKIGTFGFAPSFYVDRYVESLVLLKE